MKIILLVLFFSLPALGDVTTSGSFVVGGQGGPTMSYKDGSIFFSSSIKSKGAGIQQRTNFTRVAATTALSSSSGFVKVTGAGAMSVDGIAAGVDGQVLLVYNATGSNMTFVHDSLFIVENFVVTFVPNENKIVTMDGANAATTGDGFAELIYDGSQAKWILTSLKP